MENDMRTVFFTACIGQNVINGRKIYVKKKKKDGEIFETAQSVCAVSKE